MGRRRVLGLLALQASLLACGDAEQGELLRPARPPMASYPLSACAPQQPGFALAAASPALGLAVERAREAAETAPGGLTVQVVEQRAESALLRYERGGVPLCGVYGRAASLGEVPFVHGPAIAALAALTPDRSRAWPAVEQLAPLLGSERLRSAEACLHVDGAMLRPAWELVFSARGETWRAFAGAVDDAPTVFRVAPAAFDAAGVARVFLPDGTLGDESLGDVLDGSGYLQGERFATVVGQAPRAYAADGAFRYPTDDVRFAEAQAFANAERMLRWLEDPARGYVLDTGCAPITLELHAVFRGGDVNNARYVPAPETDDGRPRIRLGDGDGVVLRNLGLDFDVVAHELGHHVVYRSVKDTSHFESVVIHEALADYLTFAMTGDACLGETICPPGSRWCALEGQCLRTGENALSFASAQLPPEPHRRGQILSGLLWDLRRELGDGVVTPLALKAVDFLLPRSSYPDLVVALMAADAVLHAGRNACAVLEGAKSRGLGDRFGGLDCAAYAR